MKDIVAHLAERSLPIPEVCSNLQSYIQNIFLASVEKTKIKEKEAENF